MSKHIELLEATIKKARKCYILEPTLEGKKTWLRLITECKKDLFEAKKALTGIQ